MIASPAWERWWSDACRDVDAGAAPGISAWVAVDGTPVLHACHGQAGLVPEPEPLRPGMIYDLASVTKAVATTSCIVRLVETGLLDLDAPVAEHCPGLLDAGKERLTTRQLLTHTSGLPAWVHFWEVCASREQVRDEVLRTPLEREPGSECVYSDVGFLTLGFLVEAITGDREDTYFRRAVAQRLGTAALGFLPADPQACVPTEACAVRKGVVRGLVHDENAWRCDGVAGHAGLFGPVEELGRFGQAMLEQTLFDAPSYNLVFAPRDDVAAERFWLGWKKPGYEADDPEAFGHDGFTGTLLWVSPRRRLVVALLTNRVHPTRANRKLYDCRPRWVREAALLAPFG